MGQLLAPDSNIYQNVPGGPIFFQFVAPHDVAELRSINLPQLALFLHRDRRGTRGFVHEGDLPKGGAPNIKRPDPFCCPDLLTIAAVAARTDKNVQTASLDNVEVMDGISLPDHNGTRRKIFRLESVDDVDQLFMYAPPKQDIQLDRAQYNFSDSRQFFEPFFNVISGGFYVDCDNVSVAFIRRNFVQDLSLICPRYIF